MFIVIWKRASELGCETHYDGPFEYHADAYDHLRGLPSLAELRDGGELDAFKFIQELNAPCNKVA